MAAVHLHPFFAAPPLRYDGSQPPAPLSISIRTRYLPAAFILSLLLRIALRGAETSPLFKFCSKFSFRNRRCCCCCVTFWKRTGHFSAPTPASRAAMGDEKVNRKKRLPSVHRPWDPQRCWWRAESAGDFGITTHKGGAEFEGILYQPETQNTIL